MFGRVPAAVREATQAQRCFHALGVAALDALLDFLAGLKPRRGGPRRAPRCCD
jgi:hypothetical protein